jgi:hypothetical protein
VEAVGLLARIVGYIDRTATFVEDVVHKVRGPSAEEQAASIIPGVLAANEKNIPALPGEDALARKRRLANSYYEQASKIYMNADAHGGMNPQEQINFEAARKLGEIYRNQGDPWSSANMPADGTMDAILSRPGTKLTREDLMKGQIEDLKYTIARAVRDGLAMAAVNTKVNVDGNTVVKAQGNASAHRTRPGGR